MKHIKSLLLLGFLSVTILVQAQNYEYEYVKASIKSPSSVSITLKTFADKKSTVDHEAKCAALKIILFEGLQGTIYSKPLLSQGLLALDEHPDYFDKLFNERLSYIIKSAKMESGFRKAEKSDKSTLYTVVVNYIQLKKDVENNKIKKQLGI